MPSEASLEKLTVAELKAKLCRVWKKYQRPAERTMAPLLYYLRDKLKAQGKTGAGFGAWVEDHLDICRRSADRWANEWAVSKGLMKPRKPLTFRQVSKSAKPNSDGKVTVPLSFVLPEREAAEFLAAMKTLGDKATSIIFNAVVAAAHPPKKPAQSAPSRSSSAAQPARKLAFLNDEEQEGTLVGAVQAGAKGARQ